VNAIDASHSTRALTASTMAFTVCFAIWTIFSISSVWFLQRADKAIDHPRAKGKA